MTNERGLRGSRCRGGGSLSHEQPDAPISRYNRMAQECYAYHSYLSLRECLKAIAFKYSLL